MMYNRVSADLEGKPWSERKKYIWWDDQYLRWTGGWMCLILRLRRCPVIGRPQIQSE